MSGINNEILVWIEYMSSNVMSYLLSEGHSYQ